MISPILVEKFALPLLDWATAIAQALGHAAQGVMTYDQRHAAQGTLCTDPAPSRAIDPE